MAVSVDPPPPDPPGGWPAIAEKPPLFGCLDRELIRAVIRQQSAELACCSATLRRMRRKAARTRLTLDFFIDRCGRVKDFTSSAEPEAPMLQACLAQVVPAWRWKPGGGRGVQVNYPLTVM